MMKQSGTIHSVLMLVLLCLAADDAAAQAQLKGKRDIYVLLTTPYNMRPLSLFRGQLAAESGYKFSVRNNSYDSDGKKSLSTNMSSGSVFHYYYATVRYGITDFIELSAETNMIRHGQREATINYISVTSLSKEQVSVSKLTETRGMGDLLLMASFRLPERAEWFDMNSTAGVYLPVSEHETEMPENKINTISTAATNEVNSQITYKYNYRHGFGVPVYHLSAALKSGLGKYRGELRFTFLTPREEGTNLRWSSTLVNKTFTYTNATYSFLLSNSFFYDASLHYQATGWFDLFFNGSCRKTKGGWTEQTGIRYANKATAVVSLEPGFELQMSPSLRIRQTAGFPIAGKNTEAPFWLFTTLNYSFFPFHGR